MKDLNVLITGGAGFLGANFVRRLLEKNIKVHLLLKPSTNIWRLADIRHQLTFHYQSLFDVKELSKLVSNVKPDFIYHLASYGNSSDEINVDETFKVNVLGTFNLLLAVEKINYKCFINTGSSSEYGIRRKPMKENFCCRPLSFYAATKLASTDLCQFYAKIYNKPIITFRPFSVYGPYEEKNRFISSILLALIKNKPICLTKGIIRHDFIFVDDLIKAYLKVLTKYDQLSGKILNLGTEKEYTNNEVVEILFKIIKKRVLVKKGAFKKRNFDTTHWVSDCKQAKKILDWQAKFSLEKGLLKTFKWFSNNLTLYEKE